VLMLAHLGLRLAIGLASSLMVANGGHTALASV